MDNHDQPVQPVIRRLQANSGKTYEWVGELKPGDRVYLDRDIRFRGVGRFQGAGYIRTASDDYAFTESTFLSFEAVTPVTVYVCYNQDVKEHPEWLATWNKLSDTIVTTEKTHTVFYRIFPAGVIHLGGNTPENGSGTKTMYFVLVKPGDDPLDAERTVAVTYPLRAQVLGKGSVRLEPAGGEYERGETVTLTAEPEPGWAFYGWIGDVFVKEPFIRHTVKASGELTAVFYRPGLAGMGVPPSGREAVVNSIGMRMIPIDPGSFVMGDATSARLPEKWDEAVERKVTITQPYYMSETEVTVEQYRQFDPHFTGEGCGDFVTGISWHDAMAFCEWLSEREGKPYRLPTEAEWEYACKAGASEPYWFDDAAIALGVPNPWGLKNMLAGPLEWCLDWYGEYPTDDETDPVGADRGIARVVRGGGFYSGAFPIWPKGVRYERPTNRGGYAPDFKYVQGNPNGFGRHPIGFRVVQAPLPETKTRPVAAPYVMQGVKQTADRLGQGPDPDKPYFRKRYLLPTPPENLGLEAIAAAGFHPSIYGHNHSPGLAMLNNGDLLFACFSAFHERTPGVNLIAARLRYGADEWDFPSPFIDFPDVNDHAPLLFHDDGKLYCFWGNPKLDYTYPFQWVESEDNGATWSPVKFPYFPEEARGGARQPINSAFRDANGTLYVASDLTGPRSVLYATRDNGRTWSDPGGNSCARHTSFALLSDGTSILGMGGKDAHIDGYMPKSLSRDGGRTWEYSPSPFNKLGARQRPALLRLASGRLFLAGDFENKLFVQPPGMNEKGCYVALSDDDGATWKVKKLAGAQLYEGKNREIYTLGYTVACQAPNGVIHLVTTTNRPCLHFELNEAWILDEEAGVGLSDAELMQPTAHAMTDIRTYREFYPDGTTKAEWSAGLGDDGRYLLHGTEVWYYPNGRKQREARYVCGRKTGVETYWAEDGTILWSWHHRDDGSGVWTQYWPNGRKKAESAWVNMKCEGTAYRWDEDGREISRMEFRNGEPV